MLDSRIRMPINKGKGILLTIPLLQLHAEHLWKLTKLKISTLLASHRGFLRLFRVLPTSRMFTSSCVNTATILYLKCKLRTHSTLG